MLGPEVVVRSRELVDAGVRRPALRARGGRYRYTILNRPVPDPFRDRFTWWVPDAARPAARCGSAPTRSSASTTSRRSAARGPRARRRRAGVLESRWVDDGDGVLRYEIRGNAFCWQMVRSIVGTLVEVGLGKRRPGEMMAILRAADARGGAAGPAARAVPLGSRLLSALSAESGLVRRHGR